MADLENLLAQQIPVIVFIQAGELAHWIGEKFQHAVVVIGIENDIVWIIDPAISSSTSVSVDEFLLAWSEMDYRFASIADTTGPTDVHPD